MTGCSSAAPVPGTDGFVPEANDRVVDCLNCVVVCVVACNTGSIRTFLPVTFWNESVNNCSFFLSDER